MESLLSRFYKGIAEYLSEYKAVSAEELMMKIDQEIDNLNEVEKKELNSLMDGNAKQHVFDGIIGKIQPSVFSPDMHVKHNYYGEVFYCPPTHRYMADELDKGLKRLLKLRYPKISQDIEEVLNNLLIKSGYNMSEIESDVPSVYKSYKAIKGEKVIELFSFESIIFVSDGLETLKDKTTKFGIVVPSETTPAPFVNFIRENLNSVMGNRYMMILSINPEQKTISPVLDPIRDKDMWSNYTLPEVSIQATQNWIHGAMKTQVLDEDF